MLCNLLPTFKPRVCRTRPRCMCSALGVWVGKRSRVEDEGCVDYDTEQSQHCQRVEQWVKLVGYRTARTHTCKISLLSEQKRCVATTRLAVLVEVAAVAGARWEVEMGTSVTLTVCSECWRGVGTKGEICLVEEVGSHDIQYSASEVDNHRKDVENETCSRLYIDVWMHACAYVCQCVHAVYECVCMRVHGREDRRKRYPLTFKRHELRLKQYHNYKRIRHTNFHLCLRMVGWSSQTKRNTSTILL